MLQHARALLWAATQNFQLKVFMNYFQLYWRHTRLRIQRSSVSAMVAEAASMYSRCAFTFTNMTSSGFRFIPSRLRSLYGFTLRTHQVRPPSPGAHAVYPASTQRPLLHPQATNDTRLR